jgi:hypothetical protein
LRAKVIVSGSLICSPVIPAALSIDRFRSAEPLLSY